MNDWIPIGLMLWLIYEITLNGFRNRNQKTLIRRLTIMLDLTARSETKMARKCYYYEKHWKKRRY